ncbi:phosphoglucosamine mutase [Dasania sp. GY-MA-18]|uniref:Phosphoglucosamine mutase n=1 Tax=Dasania phycosphaerae TaxID=2950436 RepID=A0A9J6RGS7_9GAMM|nr:MULTISPECIES: phosphoglucosamine mutase [Dasania]MCR8921240.1 phosphoglucosamine mutase [Dasania sp. GY-MA-18]MCZ0863668.1 phosphoglucosamine mutase [Dasania phycosphaerae]MCZ0867396.1 phosphoglucosamine mutase [Dasania phycosphaerae]
MTRKYFGTDGIRGLVGTGAITPEFVLKLGWAVGKVFARKGRCKIIIGKDTRISGYMFESALEAGLVAAGADVCMLGPMPTPAVAYLTRTFHAQAGIVISASHNPYHDNGIKFFSAEGTKLPDEVELEIERQLDEPMTTVDSAKLGKVTRINDAAGRYIEFCKSTVPSGFSLQGLKMVVDCAHGATYQVAPAVFEELGAEVIIIADKPNGLNINEQVGSTKPQALQQRVLMEKADLGVAFDGDGDRLVFVDRNGRLIDGDELLFVIVQDAIRTTGACAGVVGTLMSNLGFELALQKLQVPFARAKVGDRYVNELMQAEGWSLGGENSGHIICADVTTTGDGLVAALKVLFAVVDSGMPLHDLVAGMSKFPQVMINVGVSDSSKLSNNSVIDQAVSTAEATLDGRGRVLLRPSGTEPVVRVMVEGEDGELVGRLAKDIAAVVEAQVA